MAAPRISTIIPAFNRADLIGETLRTVLSQTLPPHEVIVVDDGSTDGTADAVTTFGRQVTLLRQKNAGAGPARNAGFARSTGEIVHFMDSDDLLSLNSYEAAVEAIRQGADMTYGPWLKTQFDGRTLIPDLVVMQQRPVPDRLPLDVLSLMVTWLTVFQPCLFRRDLIERAGAYRSDLKPSEDAELLYRVLLNSRSPVHVSRSILLYRVHPQNQVSEQNFPARQRDWAHLWCILQEHFSHRSDLSAKTKMLFRRQKYAAARQVRPYAPEEARFLTSDIGALEQALFSFLHLPAQSRLVRRVLNKIRRISTGSPYTWPFATGPLRADQRDQILRLGYSLPVSS